MRRDLSKLFNLFRGQHPQDLAEEMRLHLQMEEQEIIEAGMSREEARLSALRRFGNVTLAQE